MTLTRNRPATPAPWPDGDNAIPAVVQQMSRSQIRSYAEQVCALMRQRLGVEGQREDDQWFVENEGLIYYLDPLNHGKLAVRTRCPGCGRLRDGHITINILADWARANRELDVLCKDCQRDAPPSVVTAVPPLPPPPAPAPTRPVLAPPTSAPEMVPVVLASSSPVSAPMVELNGHAVAEVAEESLELNVSLPPRAPLPAPTTEAVATLRKRAALAFQRDEQERILLERREQEAERLRRVDRLCRLLWETLRVNVEPDAVATDIVEIDGLCFSAKPYDHDYYLHVQLPCQDCGTSRLVRIESLAQLGKVLASPPDCPTCARSAMAEATDLSAAASPEARLNQALRDFVRQAI